MGGGSGGTATAATRVRAARFVLCFVHRHFWGCTMQPWRSFVFLAAALLGATGTATAAIVFSDDTMSTALFSSNPTYVTSGVTVSSSTVGGVLQTDTGSMTGQTSYGFVAGHLYSSFVYDPVVSGAVTSIDFSLDRGAASYFNANNAGVAGITLRVLIEQNGHLYQYVGPLLAYSVSPDLSPYSVTGLLATDFGEWSTATNVVDLGSNPDFAAGPMEFGFATRVGPTTNTVSDTVELVTFADNFRLEVNQVPEPATVWLILTALGALGLTRRRQLL